MPKRLLPLIPAGLLVQQVLPTPEHITIKASPRQNAAACPDCGVASRRVHSRYGRTLADLPWQGRPVTLAVHARRFRCLNPACARQTFAERLAEVLLCEFAMTWLRLRVGKPGAVPEARMVGVEIERGSR